MGGRRNTTLRPYLAWAGDDPGEGSVLVFALTGRQARPIALGLLSGWMDCCITEVRWRLMRNHTDYLMTLANPEKVAARIAHGFDDIPSCGRCDHWGEPITDGVCSNCLENDDG